MNSKPPRSIIEYPYVFLAIVLIFHVVCNYLVLSFDTTAPTYDEEDHLRTAFYAGDDFGKIGFKKLYYDLGWGVRPPLYRLGLTVLYFFQREVNADRFTLFINTLFFAVLLISVYGIGARLYNVPTALFAAGIVSAFPGVFAMSRVLMVDFPLASLVCLSIYTLLRTEYFTDMRFSILFGISLGLGMLMKTAFLVFILPILAFFIFAAYKNNKGQNTLLSVGIHILVSCLIALFVAGSWYLPNLHRILDRLNAMVFQTPKILRGVFMAYYIKVLYSTLVGRFFFILFVFFLIFCKKRKIILLFLWLLAPLLLLSLSTNKNPRFVIPLLPPLGIIIAGGISEIKHAIARKAVAALVMGFGLCSVCVSSSGRTEAVPARERLYYSWRRVHTGIRAPERAVDWKVAEAAEIIYRDAVFEGMLRKARLWSLFNIGEIHSALEYDLLTRGMRVFLLCPGEQDCFDSTPLEGFSSFHQGDYVVAKSGYQGENCCRESNRIRIVSELFDLQKENLFLIGSVPGLPDGSTLYVYKKI